jgi:hypothetical protein
MMIDRIRELYKKVLINSCVIDHDDDDYSVTLIGDRYSFDDGLFSIDVDDMIDAIGKVIMAKIDLELCDSEFYHLRDRFECGELSRDQYIADRAALSRARMDHYHNLNCDYVLIYHSSPYYTEDN